MKDKTDVQKKILVKLMHNRGLRYNKLWNKEGESNKFNYHLQKLVETGIVEKKEEIYCLTIKGKKLVTSLEGSTGEEKSKPVVCVFILGNSTKENKILVHLRKKEPFYDFAGIIAGKVEFGETPIHAAKREFKEETGLSGNLKLKTVANYITESKNELMHHIIAFTYICKNPSGELILKHREGENVWVTFEEFKKLKRFPEIDNLIEKTLQKNDEVNFLNSKRIQDGELFTSEIIKEF